MHVFRSLDKQIGLVPAGVARTVGEIDTSRGRADAFRRQRPQILGALIDVARIQGTEASDAIEGAVAPHKRVPDLDSTAPGDRHVLDLAGPDPSALAPRRFVDPLGA